MLGIGDSVAAVIGTKYGKHKWSWPTGSQRSLEGSFSALISMIFSAYLLSIVFSVSLLVPSTFNYLTTIQVPLTWSRIIMATTLSCALEALTDQIDNVILPLHYMALLNVC